MSSSGSSKSSSSEPGVCGETKMKFTLRDLFWLTLVVSVVLAWWMDLHDMQEFYDNIHHQLIEELRATTQKVYSE